MHAPSLPTYAEVIVKYRGKIRSLEVEIKQILKQEEEEKQLRLTEMEINRASNLIEHRDEIMSRPARTWIKTSGKKRPAPGDSGEGDEVRGDLTAGLPSKKAKREEIKKGLEKKRKDINSVSCTYVAVGSQKRDLGIAFFPEEGVQRKLFPLHCI